MSEDYQAPSGAGHPITPPPELVQQLRSEAPHGIRDAGVTRELHLIAAAYRAGADQELAACCEQLRILGPGQQTIDRLRAARRFKPPSLSEPALQALVHLDKGAESQMDTTEAVCTIRRALERLRDLEDING